MSPSPTAAIAAAVNPSPHPALYPGESSWLDASLRPSPRVLFQRVGNAAILLDLASERYFELNEVGAALWLRLQAGEGLPAAFRFLLADYAVAPEVLASDLHHLLGQLLAKGLLVRD